VRDDLAQQRLWRLPPEEGLVDVDIDLLWLRARKMNAPNTPFSTAWSARCNATRCLSGSRRVD
jgi:hypothetical protein